MFGNTTASVTHVAACDPVTGTVHRPGKPAVKIS
jgi:hypothetical protein